jgi:type III restriction enzyme
MFRNLWEHIRQGNAEEGARQQRELDPLKLPAKLQTALKRSTATTKRPSKLWQNAGIKVPPCFIIVCQQHGDLEARLRLHLGLPAQER